MLDVIGAGATASSEQDWHETWKDANEFDAVQKEIARIHEIGRRTQISQESIGGEFASPWFTQFKELARRDWIAHYRDPTYLVAKLALNIISGELTPTIHVNAISDPLPQDYSSASHSSDRMTASKERRTNFSYVFFSVF